MTYVFISLIYTISLNLSSKVWLVLWAHKIEHALRAGATLTPAFSSQLSWFFDGLAVLFELYLKGMMIETFKVCFPSHKVRLSELDLSVYSRFSPVTKLRVSSHSKQRFSYS